MTVRFPAVKTRLGLGLGMDLPWGSRVGFAHNNGQPNVTDNVQRFLGQYRNTFRYLFFAFQPQNRSVLDAPSYFSAYDRLFECVPKISCHALHHTMLNMGSMEQYSRTKLLRFTNELIRRYNFAWVVEDLGLWSIAGKRVPFPLPPFMTEAGLEACIRNVNQIQSMLDTALCIEFPGFTEGVNFHIGRYDAFDYFRILAEETRSAVTIDIGHILSYQWLRGNSRSQMLDGLERLPLDQCFEFHLSGCQIKNGKFRDLHHGILLDEQIAMFEYLLPLCANLKGVTYEDPKYTDDGVLVPKSRRNFLRLRRTVEQWAQCA